MQQISKIRLESDEDVKNVESVRLLRKVVVTKGLCLHVTPKGGRSWHYKFYFEGRCQNLFLGTHPEISLDCAKSRHQYARKLRANGINPCAIKRTLGRNAFRIHMREWETMQTVFDPTARHVDLASLNMAATSWAKIQAELAARRQRLLEQMPSVRKKREQVAEKILERVRRRRERRHELSA